MKNKTRRLARIAASVCLVGWLGMAASAAADEHPSMESPEPCAEKRADDARDSDPRGVHAEMDAPNEMKKDKPEKRGARRPSRSY